MSKYGNGWLESIVKRTKSSTILNERDMTTEQIETLEPFYAGFGTSSPAVLYRHMWSTYLMRTFPTTGIRAEA